MIQGQETQIFLTLVSVTALLKTWCKYRYGVFEEFGLPGDHLYPEYYFEGNQTIPNAGCQLDEDYEGNELVNGTALHWHDIFDKS